MLNNLIDTLSYMKDAVRYFTPTAYENAVSAILSGKSRKAKRTAIMVLYGHKKDRGQIKQKLMEQLKQEQEKKKVEDFILNKYFSAFKEMFY